MIFFLKMAKGGKFAKEYVSNGIYFLKMSMPIGKKIRKFSALKMKECFFGKNLFIFLKAFFTEEGKRKILRW